jgi:Rod binding domain-containing protein
MNGMSMSNLNTMNTDAANRPGGAGPANPLVDTSGRFNRLQQAFQGQLKGLANDFYKMYHKALVLTDTFRTDAEQAQAHRAKPRLALPAGSPYAMHPKGLAVDVDVGESKMITPEMLVHNGLHRPALSKGETWHIEPVSTASNYRGHHDSSSSENLATSPARSRGLSGSRVIQGVAEFRAQCKRPDAKSHQSSGVAGAPADQRLQQTAVEMESVFLEQLLGQMRKSMVDPINQKSEQLRGYLSMADQNLDKSLAAGGGIGLAARIIKDLASLKTQPHTEKDHEENPNPGKPGAPTGNSPV